MVALMLSWATSWQVGHEKYAKQNGAGKARAVKKS
jgi:hypothetical protein